MLVVHCRRNKGTARSASMRGRAAFGTRRSMLMNKRAVALLAILALIPLPACQTLPTQETIVPLKSRTIVIAKEEISPAFPGRARHYSLATSARFSSSYTINRTARPSALSRPRVCGCCFTSPRAYGVCLGRKGHFRRGDATVQRQVRWLGEIQPGDKIAPELRENRPYTWAVQQDGRIKLSVEFSAMSRATEAEAIVKRHTKGDATLGGRPRLVSPPALRGHPVPRRKYDLVKWIDQVHCRSYRSTTYARRHPRR